MKHFLLYIFFLASLPALAQKKIDSLNALLKSAEADSEKVKLLTAVAMQYSSNDPETALQYTARAMKIVSERSFDTVNNNCRNILAALYRTHGVMHYFMGNYRQALNFLNNSANYCSLSRNVPGEAAAYGWIANTYYSQGDFEKALSALLKALKLQETINNKDGIAGSLNGIANIYHRQHEIKKALEYYFKSLAIRTERGDSVNIGYCYNNIGLAYAEVDSFDKALDYHKKCLWLVQRYDDKKGIANSLGNLGELFSKQKKFTEALPYLTQSLEVSKAISDRNGISASYYAMGLSHAGMGHLKNAQEDFTEALTIASEIGDKDAVKDCNRELAAVYFRMGNYPNALTHYERYMAMKDSLANASNTRNLGEMQTRFETEKKEQEIQLLQKDKNIRDLRISEQQANINRQRIAIYSIITGLAAVIALVFFILKSYREKKKINIGLERKNMEINLQKKLIEEKNTLITDSIDYARNIQQAILPSDAAIRQHLPEWFIFFLPKDIVSGDFYWMHPTDDGILFATVDCTGHGVPGAFMSVMACNMLENIVGVKKVSRPASVLDELNKTVLKALRQETADASAKFGMDISLIYIDRKKSEVQFAGAHNPMIVVTEHAEQTGSSSAAAAAITKTIKEFKADRTTIGMARANFSNHSFQYQSGDMIYLFTDGYADQKGGPEHKKLFTAAFHSLLTDFSHLPCEKQKQHLQNAFLQWKDAQEQIDDILVAGIRV